MKKSLIKIVLTVCFLTACFYTDAQIGITGGMNLSSMRNSSYHHWDYTYKAGFHIGAFYDYDLSRKFKFQPSMILLNESSRRFISGKSDETSDFDEAFHSYSCFIPLVFSYKLPIKTDSRFLIDLGLYGSIGLWGKHDQTVNSARTKTDLYRDYVSTFDCGFIAGAGYDTKRMNYSLRLKQGLRNIFDSFNKPTTILFSVGYKLK